MWTLFLWHVCVADEGGPCGQLIQFLAAGVHHTFASQDLFVALQRTNSQKQRIEDQAYLPASTCPLSDWLSQLAAAKLSTNERREPVKRGVACAGWCVARGKPFTRGESIAQ